MINLTEDENRNVQENQKKVVDNLLTIIKKENDFSSTFLEQTNDLIKYNCGYNSDNYIVEAFNTIYDAHKKLLYSSKSQLNHQLNLFLKNYFIL